jgi:hypothetical protein
MDKNDLTQLRNERCENGCGRMEYRGFNNILKTEAIYVCPVCQSEKKIFSEFF